MSFLLCIFTMLLVCSAYAGPIKLRFNYSMPMKKSIAGSWHWYGDEIEKQTNGRVKFEYFPLSGLFSPAAVRDNMLAGTADLCNLSASTEDQRMPLAGIFSLPTVVFPNDVAGTVAASNTAIELISEFPDLAAEFNIFKIIAYQYLTAYGLFTKTPIYLPSELKGMKIRAAAMHAEFINSVGGGAVNIVPPKTYMSLKTGVIDGGILSMSQISDYKLWEIGKDFTDVYMGRTLFSIIMNKESWNALPKDIQQIMDAVSDSMVRKGAEIMHAENDEGLEKYLAQGGQIIKLKPEQEKAWDDAKAGLNNYWVEEMNKKGKGEVAKKMLKRFKEIAAEKTKTMR